MSHESENTISAQQAVEDNVTEYSAYIVASKLPHLVDGLKISQRRALWIYHQEGKEDTTLSYNSRIAAIHPHGDGAIHETTVKMMQPFHIGEPLITGVGNTGIYSEPTAAAPRYLHAHISEFSEDVYFRGLSDRAIPKMVCETMKGYEPQYLIPSVPMALVLGALTVGYGCKTVIPPGHFRSVCDLTLRFLDHINDPKIQSISRKYPHFLIPDFPIGNKITNYEELIASYKSGNFNSKINLEGNIELDGQNLIIRLVPYNISYRKKYEQLLKQCKSKSSWFHDKVDDYLDKSNVSDEACFIMTFKRNVNMFEAYQKVTNAMSNTSSMTPIRNYVFDRKIVHATPDILLSRWFHIRASAVIQSNKHQQAKLMDQLHLITAQLHVCDHREETLEILKDSSTIAEAIHNLRSKFGITNKVAEIIVGTKIERLIRESADKLRQSEKEIKAKIDNIIDNIDHPEKIVRGDIEHLKRKYGRPRKSIIPKYIGCFRTDKGTIQFSSVDELTHMLRSIKGEQDILFYSETPKRRKQVIGGSLKDTPNLTVLPDTFVVEVPKKATHTVAFREGCACVTKGIKWQDGFKLRWTSEDVIAVSKNGKMSEMKVTDFCLRKTICKGSKTNIIDVIDMAKKDSIVVHANSSMPNVIRFERLTLPTGKLNKLQFMVSGETQILGVFPEDTSDTVYVYIPTQMTNRNSISVIAIENIVKLMDGKSSCQLSLSKTKKPVRGMTFVRSTINKRLAYIK